MRRRWGEIGKKSNSYTFDFILKIIKEEWTLKQLPQNLCILYKNFVKPHVGFFVHRMYFYIDNFSVKLSYVRVCIDEQNKSICRIFRQSILLIFYFVVPTKSWDFFFREITCLTPAAVKLLWRWCRHNIHLCGNLKFRWWIKIDTTPQPLVLHVFSHPK